MISMHCVDYVLICRRCTIGLGLQARHVKLRILKCDGRTFCRSACKGAARRCPAAGLHSATALLIALSDDGTPSQLQSRNCLAFHQESCFPQKYTLSALPFSHQAAVFLCCTTSRCVVLSTDTQLGLKAAIEKTCHQVRPSFVFGRKALVYNAQCRGTTAGLRSDTDKWLGSYEDATNMANETLSNIQVSCGLSSWSA